MPKTPEQQVHAYLTKTRAILRRATRELKQAQKEVKELDAIEAGKPGSEDIFWPSAAFAPAHGLQHAIAILLHADGDISGELDQG